MSKVLKNLKPYIFAILISCALIFVQSIMDLNLPNIMSKIVNDGVMNQDLDKVWAYGREMLLVSGISLICAIISTFIAAKVSAGFAKKLRNEVYTKVEEFSLGEFDKINTSSLITRTTNDITQIQNLILMMIRMMISAPMLCIGGIIMAVSKDVGLSMIFVVIIPVLIGAIVLLAGKIVPLFTTLQSKIDRMNQIVREKLTGTRVIRAFGTEDYERRRFGTSNKGIFDVSLKAAYIMSVLMPLFMFIINVSSVVIIWFGVHRVEAGALQIGDMMAFMQYAMQVLFALLMVTMVFIIIPRAIVSAKRINEVLSLDSSVKDNTDGVGVELNPEEKGTIEFNNVSFRYSADSEPVIDNMTFKINRGETVAIIGGTGSGKTTILNLILRFYDATSGSIKVGGKDVKEITQNSLRNMIGYVPQKANLFSGTLAENIRYGKQEATNEEVMAAAEVAQASEFISSLDKGIDSEVSQGGINYSGGQKQRIAIARAIIKNPEIYIFDDSFSALDYTTDAKLRDSLNEHTNGATFIIVAQRVSTIMGADNILLIDEGKILAQGKHHELLESCQEYKEIVMSQITEKEANKNGK